MEQSVELSRRLQEVVSCVSCYPVADVGTDHGYVAIALAQKETGKVFGSDVNAGPLFHARENVARFGVEEKVELRLGSGLTPFQRGEIRSAVFAGMGGMLILRLLEEKREVTDGLEELVLSPQQDIPAVRKGVEALGFGIIEEKMLKEDGKYYVIIHCRRGAVPYTKPIDYLYGGKLLEEKNLVLLAFLREEEKRVHTIARRLKAAQTPKAQERLREVEQESILIQEAVACLQH